MCSAVQAEHKIINQNKKSMRQTDKTQNTAAVRRLLEKSDMSPEHKKLIGQSILKAIQIKRNLTKIIAETTMLPSRRSVADDALRSVDDVIACIAIASSKTELSYALDMRTGKYVLAKRETDISEEIETLTGNSFRPNS